MSEFFTLLREDLTRSIRKAMNTRTLTLYASIVIVLTAISLLLPYQTQVRLSITAGFAVALLLPSSMILSRGFKPLDTVFIIGILSLITALLNSDLPTRAVLENVRHFSLILSLALTGLYVALQSIHRTRIKSRTSSMKGFSTFFSVFSTTLSSELCSCLHPTLFLESMGIVAFLPNQVRLGFVIMISTLLHQTRLTYEAYNSRRNRIIPKTQRLP